MHRQRFGRSGSLFNYLVPASGSVMFCTSLWPPEQWPSPERKDFERACPLVSDPLCELCRRANPRQSANAAADRITAIACCLRGRVNDGDSCDTCILPSARIPVTFRARRWIACVWWDGRCDRMSPVQHWPHTWSDMTDTATNCFQRCQCHEADGFADELPALIIQVCNTLRSSLAAAAARCTLPPPHAARCRRRALSEAHSP